MIKEMTVFKCWCVKCEHSWVTKTSKIPASCPKCHRVTWNEDYDGLAEGEIPMSEEEMVSREEERQIKLAALRSSILDIENNRGKPEEKREDDLWVRAEKPKYDPETGEYVYYEEHPKFGRREISREIAMDGI